MEIGEHIDEFCGMVAYCTKESQFNLVYYGSFDEVSIVYSREKR